MTDAPQTPRSPRAFPADFEGLRETDAALDEIETPPGVDPKAGTTIEAELGEAGEPVRRGIRWGAILLAAGSALASLALALSFARFVSIAIERQDWIGWTAFVLLGLVLVSAAVLILREIGGFWRLRRLGRTRLDAERALREGDKALERSAVERLVEPLRRRPELKWALSRLSEHARQVRDAGDLLRIADRDVLLIIDGDARRLVAGSARRVATVSAISPTALVTVGWVLIENLRLIRQLGALYGGRPGFMATAKLARMVFTHIVATGGLALTDDLVGQFLGQDILRRLSRRLGESVFNAALTARIGAAAIEVIRPLPYIEAPRVRARDFLSEITRRTRESGSAGAERAT